MTAETQSNLNPELVEAPTSPPLLLTVAMAAQALSLSESMMFRLLRTGEVKSFRIHGLRRIRSEDIDLFIARAAQGETP